MQNRSADPSTPSLAHEKLAPLWAMIKTILAGAKAVRQAGEAFLPKFPAENKDEYARRKESAPWRPEFEDAVRAISARPFTKEVKLVGDASTEMKALAEDIDGRGNNLNVFAKVVFEGGVSLGANGILVDFPTMKPNATMAEERAANARPYWVSVCADEIISLQTTKVGAKEIVSHLRIKECEIVRNGFEEKVVEKIRIFEPGKWEVWHQTDVNGTKVWAIESQGVLTLDEVPFVYYTTAKREGSQYVRPPLLDLADMQVELYRKLSRNEQIYTMAGSPMLTANGMAKPGGDAVVELGPGRVLYAPGGENIQTSWEYIQPDAANLKELREDGESTIEDMRRLGMQPMLPKTGDVTATASGVEAAKAHTAVGTWGNGLKDALEQAFVFTAKWMKSSEKVSVSVHTDFGVTLKGVEEIRELREARKAGDISQETYWEELSRRGVLGPSFDPEEEVRRLLAETPADDGQQEEPTGAGAGA